MLLVIVYAFCSCVVFFFKQKTAYEMRISDWSSDVCSSDLAMGQMVTGIANFQTWQFVVRWGSGEDGPGEATGFAIALDILSVVVGTIASAVLVADRKSVV